MNRHAGLIKLGLDSNPIHASKLIAEYARFPSPSSLSHAHRVFDQVPFYLQDTPLWASLISLYSRSHQPHNALHLFFHMLRPPQAASNALPNTYVFASVARAIASAPEQLSLGQTLHAHVIKSGFLPQDVVVETALVDMYAKCGVVTCAYKLFDEMPRRNLVTWNAMISGYIQNGMDLMLGEQMHGFAIVSGFELNCLNAIATMYFHCGEVGSAEKVLDGIGGDFFVTLIKIRGYVSNAKYRDALNCISSANNGIMILRQDHKVIVPLLTACARLCLLRVGKQLHGLISTLVESCFQFNLSYEDGAIIGCALIDMYSKCGDVCEARKVFDHLLPQNVSHGNSMMSGYIYNELIGDARALLEILPEKNVVSWTTMMTGYVQSGKPKECLSLLAEMYCSKEGLIGNCLTFVVSLEACSYLTDLENGKQIHAKVVRTLVSAATNNVVIGTALIDMYSKSGNLNYAQTVFDLMVEKNVVAWTSIIMGHAVHGNGFDALKLFHQMIGMGVEPNEVTFVAVLTACSHCGLVDNGLQYFKMMKKYGLVPREDHQTCVIDMLGRFGRLDEAFYLLEEIEDTDSNCESSYGTAWAALLGASQLHGNIKLGERIAKRMVNRNQTSTAHVTLSNAYAAAGLWDEAYGVRESWRREGDVNGEPGFSSISTHLQNS
ncbi:pentatricopeptide repeat-containing protein At3g22690-like [Coffea arabica]|uniref:Pentatricopeptide repeat-containing protein At3g22690-like n=1 Tax=Coffea arabica TaxID=13443 RepID=A0ABM4X0N9_COFAR